MADLSLLRCPIGGAVRGGTILPKYGLSADVRLEHLAPASSVTRHLLLFMTFELDPIVSGTFQMAG